MFYLHIRHLQKQGPEEDKLKYITGEWFYEVKSQRHQDRIHGSDIIMASMKQKKPITVGKFRSNNYYYTKIIYLCAGQVDLQ